METSRSKEDIEDERVRAVACALMLRYSSGGGRHGRVRFIKAVENESEDLVELEQRTLID